jgi:hypothetical protein
MKLGRVHCQVWEWHTNRCQIDEMSFPWSCNKFTVCSVTQDCVKREDYLVRCTSVHPHLIEFWPSPSDRTSQVVSSLFLSVDSTFSFPPTVPIFPHFQLSLVGGFEFEAAASGSSCRRQLPVNSWICEPIDWGSRYVRLRSYKKVYLFPETQLCADDFVPTHRGGSGIRGEQPFRV